MARPIPLDLPPRDPREELRKRLEEAPIEHAEALLDSYELLQELHDHGVFQLLRGAIGASDKLIETAVDAAKSDESVRAIRNAIILGKMLGSINPEVLQSVAVAVSETLGCYEKPIIEPPGLFSLLAQFSHKELRRSIGSLEQVSRKPWQSNQVARGLQINKSDLPDESLQSATPHMHARGSYQRDDRIRHDSKDLVLSWAESINHQWRWLEWASA